MHALVYLLVGAPLAGTLVLTFLGKQYLKGRAHLVTIGAMALSFLAAARLFVFVLQGGRAALEPFTWIKAGGLDVSLGLVLDPLSALFAFFVTLVGLLIHIYSAGYMHGDGGYPRYFSFLNLFVFCMLMLVLADNFLLLFLFWEGVGLCSYLLIGHWFTRPQAAAAAQKAFLVNRVGDSFFIAGIFLVLVIFKGARFDELFLAVPGAEAGVVTLIALLLFAGATGKSAQIPLFTWLPDAMEGPTPVSALIHAATMVTAGVYMIARLFPLFLASPAALAVIAWVGALTALMAATIALKQNDIKRVLAYSTISQLGYMFLALGLALPAAAIFHLVTHAFFKALLFLGAGSIMHALHNTTDIRQMGGLKGPLKWTWAVFLVGSLALAGVPPLSGFFSKEEILKGAFSGGYVALGWLALVTAFLTSFYIFRVYYLVFHSSRRAEGGAQAAHESGPSMVIPLLVLSLASVVAGAWKSHAGRFSLDQLFAGTCITDHAHHGGADWVVAASMSAAFAGIILSYLIYGRGIARLALPRLLAPLAALFERKYWVDELYDHVITRPLNALSRFLRGRVDEAGVDGGVRLVAETFATGSTILGRVQGGVLQGYVLIMLGAIIIVLGIFLGVVA